MKSSLSTVVKLELSTHLEQGMAFRSLSSVLNEIPYEKLGLRPKNLPYSIFELFYHIHFAQRDILDFIWGKSYTNPDWPSDYWSENEAPKDEEEWENLKSAYFADQVALKEFLAQEKNILNQPVKHATQAEQTLLREVLLILTHTAYHTGEIMVLMRVLDIEI